MLDFFMRIKKMITKIYYKEKTSRISEGFNVLS